jgi:hypothetical protein
MYVAALAAQLRVQLGLVLAAGAVDCDVPKFGDFVSLRLALRLLRRE